MSWRTSRDPYPWMPDRGKKLLFAGWVAVCTGGIVVVIGRALDEDTIGDRLAFAGVAMTVVGLVFTAAIFLVYWLRTR